MPNHTTQSAAKFDISTKLAFDRTRVAYERTMLAWVRTATSLITFGFSVYKFFQLETEASEHVKRLVGPREFALMMILLGLVSLTLGAGQHVVSLRQLRAQYPALPRSLAIVPAAFISIFGLLALLAVIFRQ